MCQRLYVASPTPLSRIKKTRLNPYLAVRAAEAGPTRVPFSAGLSHVHLAEAHVRCGCGFPSLPAMDDPGARVKDIVRKSDDADLVSMRALAQSIRSAVEKRGTVELCLCWAHEELDEPASRRTARIAERLDPTFRLRNREVLAVAR
jgi:hypothetical protein